jgi:hypothetical protein
MAKHGEATMGGTRPSKRSPLSESSGEARAAGMNLDAGVKCDEPHDALGIDSEASVLEAAHSRSIQSRPSGLSIRRFSLAYRKSDPSIDLGVVIATLARCR